MHVIHNNYQVFTTLKNMKVVYKKAVKRVFPLAADERGKINESLAFISGIALLIFLAGVGISHYTEDIFITIWCVLGYGN